VLIRIAHASGATSSGELDRVLPISGSTEYRVDATT